MGEIVKEGWLLKRGEYIKNWRSRYLRLYSDGKLLGYKDEADTEPVNNFCVDGCTITSGKQQGKNFVFVLGFFQLTSLVDRVLAASSNEERFQWMEAIREVRSNLLEKRQSEDQGEQQSALSLKSFELLKLIGQGSFGKVILARQISTGEISAMKVLRKKDIIARKELSHLKTEAHVLQKIRHPFLTTATYMFQTKNHLCIGMEYLIGGDMFSLLNRARRFTETRASFYAAEVSLGIGFLHSQHIIYRDLKLENVLLDEYGHIRIADFGLCKENISFEDSAKTFCGTPEYLAPEVIDSEEYGRAVDWWSVGVLIYQMVTGKMPFHGDREKVMKEILRKEPYIPDIVSVVAKDIIHRLMEKSPKYRLGGGVNDIEDVKPHPFFSSINWRRLELKEVPPPWQPVVKSTDDTSHFDEEFTSQPILLTPPNSETEFISEDDPFAEF